ncbi:MAG: NAD(P)H-hydrate dehydratase [Ruminococcaceae bacterium]|nr:NAD(P)H-hydrate dehydratase [Oscillospiraceae bacterium]
MLILTKEQIKELEEGYVQSGMDHIKLMEAAGNAVGRFIHEKFGITGKSIAVLCGSGNNGGDGFMAARKLLENGAKVCVLLADGMPKTPDAIDMYGRAERAGVMIIDCAEEEPEKVDRLINEAEIIVDAIYGLGFRDEPPEQVAQLIQKINLAVGEVIAVDIPSGVSGDSGQVASTCVKANYTVTFTAMKPGHIIYPGADYCGTVLCSAIGIEETAAEAMAPQVSAVDYQNVRLCFSARKQNTYKGDYGSLLAVCGSYGMAGAAVLAGKAAVQSGVGLVRMVLPDSIYPIVGSQLLDAVYYPMNAAESGTLSIDDCDRILELAAKQKACLVGCGMGCSDDTKEIVGRLVLESPVPLVIDADALNVLAEDVYLLKEAKSPVIITPHAGEMGRLTNADADVVQQRRLALATEFAAEFGVYVVLKGANTIIAAPDGTARVNLTGNPGMAKGGSGDVLAGIIGSLLAQGMSPADACECGVYIHGTAGDSAASNYSHHAMTPMDIILELPGVFLDIER